MPAFLTETEIEVFRTRLREEAERQFLSTGFDAVSMRSLTKALGCSPTTPYRYFKNKNEILASVRAAILNRICEKLEATECDDPREWTARHLKTFVDFAFDESNAYRLVFDLFQSNEADYPEMVLANARAVLTNRKYVERLVDDGYLDGDPEKLAYMYFAELHGLIVLRMTGRPMTTRQEFDERCRACFAMMTKGVSPRNPARGRPRARCRTSR